jgi:hypothetical protein
LFYPEYFNRRALINLSGIKNYPSKSGFRIRTRASDEF